MFFLQGGILERVVWTVSECTWKQEHEGNSMPCAHSLYGKGRGLRGIVLPLITWPQMIRHTTRWGPSVHLYLLHLTVKVASCFACFKNKNGKFFVLTTLKKKKKEKTWTGKVRFYPWVIPSCHRPFFLLAGMVLAVRLLGVAFSF